METIISFTNPCVVYGNDVEKLRLSFFNHYEYDDKTTNYLKSFFPLSNNGVKNSTINTIHNPRITLHVFVDFHATFVQ